MKDMGAGRGVYVRHRLDLSPKDILFGLGSCLLPWRRGRLESKVLGLCSANEDGLVCHSVRSGWDLWLGVQDFLVGDEVLVSAVTHPDMIRIIREHGLRPIPVDLDPRTLMPLSSALEAALTPRMRVVLVVHHFGGRMDLGLIAGFARKHGLILVEDCAQAFQGPEQVGDTVADVSMYSFGTLKTSTALGGAVLRVSDRDVLYRMRRTQAHYPVQRRAYYAKKLLVSVLALAIASGVALAKVVTCPTGANGLCVGTGNNDTLNGTNLPDDMRGLEGQDTLNAKGELDALSGGRGNDTLRGEADNDSLSGDLGNDTLLGGPGDDEYRFTNGWGRDRIAFADQGMAGERLTFSLVTRPVKMDLISSAARPEAESGTNTLNFGPDVGVNSIDGSSSGDDIKGDDGGDSINGIQGNDTIRGRGGVDDLMGMDGSDDLFGGSGNDNFDAGKGADTVRAVDGEADQILCGPGDDTAFRDPGLDVVQGCENLRQ